MLGWRCHKDFRERKPVTWYALAPAGRQALDAHLRALEDLIGPH